MSVTIDSSRKEPTFVKQTLSSPKWLDSINIEYNALLLSKTRVMVPQYSNRTTIGSKWIFCIKKLASGSLEKRKPIVVAQGYK